MRFFVSFSLDLGLVRMGCSLGGIGFGESGQGWDISFLG